MTVNIHTRYVLATTAALAIVAATRAGEPAHVCVPVGGGPDGIAELSLAEVAGVTAAEQHVEATHNSPAMLRIAFQKTGLERRIVAVAGRPEGPIAGATVVAVSCRVNAPQITPQVVLVVFENDGGAWYRLGKMLPASEDFADLRIPLGAGFSRCRFATDSDQDVRWDQVDRVWLGLLIDGPADGVWEIRRAVLTNELFRPSGPLALQGEWTVSHDQDVQGKLTRVDDGPANGPAMKYAFRMPGGRHMYAVPRLPVEVDELASYAGLRFTYQAELPAGINGLLVMLIEADGTQYFADPAPAATTGDWRTVTLPFAEFRRGAWSPDENGQLDLDQVRGVAIGMHGTSQGAEATGQIRFAAVQFVP